MFRRVFPNRYLKIAITSNYYSSSCGSHQRIAHLLVNKPLQSSIIIQGWVKSIRKMSKKMTFIDLCDGSSLRPLQVLLMKQKPPSNLSFHSSVELHGVLQESKHPGQEVEFLATTCKVIGETDAPTYPFTLFKDTSKDEDLRMRQIPHFRHRHKSIASMLRVRSQLKKSIMNYFENEGFFNIDTPIITSNDCEGGGDIFQVKEKQDDDKNNFFGKTAYLTVSGQMHLEAAASGLSKVYTINPAFRAENSVGRRHLSEFWMVEAEQAFLQGTEGESQLIHLISSLLIQSLKEVCDKLEEDVNYHWSLNPSSKELVENMINNKFTTLKYSEAIEILIKNADKLKTPVVEGKSLLRNHELFLTKYFDNSPVFITRWPRATKGFYACETDEDPDLVYGVELLVPGVGELVGGSLREYRTEKLEKYIKEELSWYLELRKFGMAPSGGFGLGFERLLIFLLGIDNIKDVILFPRSIKNCFG